MRLSSGARKLIVLLPAPLLTLILYLATTGGARHVLWYGDPDFGYLFNSLLLLEGKTPWHVDHPGTPLQLLGAVLMWLRYQFSGEASALVADLLRDPIGYHSFVRAWLVAFLMAAQAWCAYRLLRLNMPAALSALAPASPFLVWDGIAYLDHVSPETLLSAAGLLLVPWLIEQKHPARAGFALAAMATLKASSLALLPCLFLFPGRQGRAKAFLAFAAAYALITIPIWPRLAWMLGWYAQLLLQGGAYGQSGTPFSFPAYLGPLGFLRHAAPLAACLLAWAWLSRGKARPLWPLVVSAALLIFLVLKHPAPRYLLALCPLIPVAMARLGAPRLPALLAYLLPALVFYPGLMASDLETRAWAHSNLTELDSRLKEKYSACHVTVLDDVGIPAFALYTGELATDREQYAAAMSEAFPNVSFRQSNLPVWRRFGGTITDAEWARTALASPCLVFLARRDGGAEFFRQIFGEEPRVLEAIGARKFYYVYGLGPAAEARLKAWAAK